MLLQLNGYPFKVIFNRTGELIFAYCKSKLHQMLLDLCSKQEKVVNDNEKWIGASICI